MSSVPNQISTTGQPRTKSVPGSDDVRRALHTHLHKTARFIKFLDAMVLVFAWLAGLLGIWLLACLVDHWLLPLSPAGRWSFWFCGVLGSVWWTVRYLLPLVFLRINPAYAAKRIEHLVPEFKNGLISWLELEAMPNHGVPRGVMAALTYRAARFIGGQDPSATVDTSSFIKLIGGVLLLLTSLVVYTMVSPKSTLVTGKRILMPWSSVQPPSRVHVLDVKPGSVELTQGKPLPIEVELNGLRRDEPVFVRYSTRDGQLLDQRVELTAATAGFRYVGELKTSPSGVEHELDYWVEAGDAISGPHQVTLSPLPSVVLDSVQLQFPAYTRLPNRTVSGGLVEAVAGTTATFIARANQSLRRGRLEINPEVGTQGKLLRTDELVEMDVEDRRLQAQWLMQLNSDQENPTKVNYRIRGYNLRGDSNPSPIIHSMSVLADVGPELTLVGPESRVLRVMPRSLVNLEVRASDPDFGLSKLTVEMRQNNIRGRSETLLEHAGLVGRQVKTLQLNLASLDASVGDQIQIWATALDNRHDPVTGQWAPNTAESEPLILEVVGPDESADVPDAPPADKPAEDNKPQEPAPQGGKDQGKNDQDATGNTPDGEPGDNQSSPPNADGSNPGASGSEAAAAPSDTPPRGDAPESGAQQGGDSSSNQQTDNQDGSSGGGSSGSSGDTSSSSNTQSGDQSAGSQALSGGTAESESGNESGQGAGSSQSGRSVRNSNRSNRSGGNPPGGQNLDNSGGQGSPSEGARQGGSSGSSQSGQPQDRARQDGQVIDQVRQYMKSQNESGSQSNSTPSSSHSSGSRSAGNPSDPSQPPSTSEQSGSGGPQPDQQTTDRNNAGGTSAQKQPGARSGNDQNQQPSASSVQDASTGAQPQRGGTGGEQSGGEGSSTSQAAADTSPTDRTSSGGDQNSGDSPAGQPQSRPSDSRQSPGGQSGTDSQNNNQQTDSPGQQTGGNQGNNGQRQNQNSTPDSKPTQNSDSAQDRQQNSQSGKSGSGSSGSEQNANGGQSGNSGSNDSEPGGSGADNSGAGQSAGGNQSANAPPGNADSQSGSQPEQSGGAQSPSGSNSSAQSDSSSGSREDESQGTPENGKQEGTSSGGQPGGQPNPGSSSSGTQPDANAPSSGSPDSGASSSGSQSSGSAGAASSSTQSGSAGGSGTPSGQSQTGGGTGAAGGDGGDTGTSDAVNQEYANETTQMVLDYLNRQKDQPDPELLKELDWTENDLRSFVDRWNTARDLSVSGDEQDKLQWQEKLRSLGLRAPKQLSTPSADINDTFQQMYDSGTRIRPPSSLRKQYEAFRKALQQSQ